jgi:hypothetical protein
MDFICVSADTAFTEKEENDPTGASGPIPRTASRRCSCCAPGESISPSTASSSHLAPATERGRVPPPRHAAMGDRRERRLERQPPRRRRRRPNRKARPQAWTSSTSFGGSTKKFRAWWSQSIRRLISTLEPSPFSRPSGSLTSPHAPLSRQPIEARFTGDRQNVLEERWRVRALRGHKWGQAPATPG